MEDRRSAACALSLFLEPCSELAMLRIEANLAGGGWRELEHEFVNVDPPRRLIFARPASRLVEPEIRAGPRVRREAPRVRRRWRGSVHDPRPEALEPASIAAVEKLVSVLARHRQIIGENREDRVAVTGT